MSQHSTPSETFMRFTLPIQRTTMSTDFIKQFASDYRMKKPVIFNTDWQAVTQWKEEAYWLSMFESDFDVEVLCAKDGQNFLKHELCQIQEMTFHDVLRAILGGEFVGLDGETKRIYYRMYLDAFPVLKGDLDFNALKLLAVEEGHAWIEADGDFVERNEEALEFDFVDKNCGVWLSSAGCVTPLHYDLCHGFLAQVVGRKRFLLARSEDTNYLARNTSIYTKNQTSSQIDLTKWMEGDEEERRNYPSVEDVQWYVADLNPGDILYTPPGWWHHVLSVDDSVSVLVPFDPSSNETLHPLQNV
eukprot:TRINITY_DN11743_c0_g1_i1.p1 TRINITY_DN11743_c0_g1~~TRINITY_DN11743_c0_g1_i1.p1  ORF type:complete len:317 (+),score=61.30 TRINITY_DN11743_c0_g1_i1:47-952(+)